jgi:hypothetical protein
MFDHPKIGEEMPRIKLHRSKHYVEPAGPETLNRSTLMFDLSRVKEILQTDVALDYGGPDLCFQVQFPGKPLYGKVIFTQGNVHVRRTADANGRVMLGLQKYRTVFHMAKVCRRKNVPRLASRILIRDRMGLASLQTFLDPCADLPFL